MRACERSPPGARTRSGSSRWPRRSVSARAASTGTSPTAGVFLEELLDTWERQSLDEVIERIESEGGDARARLRHLFAARLRRWSAPEGRPCHPRLGPARHCGRQAPAPRRQPAHGLPALAVRGLLLRRGRGGGPLPARRLTAGSAATTWLPSTGRAAGPRCWSWRCGGCWSKCVSRAPNPSAGSRRRASGELGRCADGRWSDRSSPAISLQGIGVEELAAPEVVTVDLGQPSGLADVVPLGPRWSRSGGR